MIKHVTISRIYDGPYLTVHNRKCDLDEGQFGAIAPYWCERCGLIWRAPEYGMTHRQTLESPEEGEEYCQECGCPYTGENEADPAPFKLVKRYRINHRAIAA